MYLNKSNIQIPKQLWQFHKPVYYVVMFCTVHLDTAWNMHQLLEAYVAYDEELNLNASSSGVSECSEYIKHF